jgi:hypothetical protein
MGQDQQYDRNTAPQNLGTSLIPSLSKWTICTWIWQLTQSSPSNCQWSKCQQSPHITISRCPLLSQPHIMVSHIEITMVTIQINLIVRATFEENIWDIIILVFLIKFFWNFVEVHIKVQIQIVKHIVDIFFFLNFRIILRLF